jgi:hypothetical protein
MGMACSESGRNHLVLVLESGWVLGLARVEGYRGDQTPENRTLWSLLTSCQIWTPALENSKKESLCFTKGKVACEEKNVV